MRTAKVFVVVSNDTRRCSFAINYLSGELYHAPAKVWPSRERRNRGGRRKLPACHDSDPGSACSSAIYNDFMPVSARNKLRGKIEEIQLGEIMAHVVVRVEDNLIESVITRRSADELKLKKGDTAVAIVKATEVMIQKD